MRVQADELATLTDLTSSSTMETSNHTGSRHIVEGRNHAVLTRWWAMTIFYQRRMKCIAAHMVARQRKTHRATSGTISFAFFALGGMPPKVGARSRRAVHAGFKSSGGVAARTRGLARCLRSHRRVSDGRVHAEADSFALGDVAPEEYETGCLANPPGITQPVASWYPGLIACPVLGPSTGAEQSRCGVVHPAAC